MNASRLAVWIVGAAVSGAWLASAAGVARQPRTIRVPPAVPETIQLDALAAEVQAQTGRLRARLASAPAPRAAQRNPFSFDSAPVKRRPARIESNSVVTSPAVYEPPEPLLELIGVAETDTPAGRVRTAMITNEQNDLIMVMAGQRILGRYDVSAVSEEAVDLKDVRTGAIRRLILH